MPMTSDETATYWHQAYVEVAKKAAEVEGKSIGQEDHISNLEGVLKDAQAALRRICDLSFEEDLAKYADGSTVLTQTSQDAIDQYLSMLDLCEKALARVDIAVDKEGN